MDSDEELGNGNKFSETYRPDVGHPDCDVSKYQEV